MVRKPGVAGDVQSSLCVYLSLSLSFHTITFSLSTINAIQGFGPLSSASAGFQIKV